MNAPAAASSTIVVVEDNPDDALLLTIEFEDAGVRNPLVLLEDGEEALRFLRREAPHADAPAPGLVLLDLHLPRIDGHEVLRAVAAEPRLRTIPIIVVSVPTELTWAEAEFGDILAGVLPKPVEVAPLSEVLDETPLGASFLLRE